MLETILAVVMVEVVVVATVVGCITAVAASWASNGAFSMRAFGPTLSKKSLDSIDCVYIIDFIDIVDFVDIMGPRGDLEDFKCNSLEHAGEVA